MAQFDPQGPLFPLQFQIGRDQGASSLQTDVRKDLGCVTAIQCCHDMADVGSLVSLNARCSVILTHGDDAPEMGMIPHQLPRFWLARSLTGA